MNVLSRQNRGISLLLLAIIAGCGAFLGNLLHLPIGLLVGSFIFVASAKVMGLNVPPMNRKYKQMVQMVIGGFVGLNLQPDIFDRLLTLLIPGVIATAFHILIAFIVSFILTKLFHIPPLTALMGSTPGGLSEIANIMDDVEVDRESVVLMHIFRISLIVLFLPALIKFFLL